MPDTTEDQTSEREIAAEALRAHLFLVLVADAPTAIGGRYELDEIDRIVFGRGAPTHAVRRMRNGVAELSIDVDASAMSADHAAISRRGEVWVLDDRGSRNGTSLNGRRVEREVLSDGDIIEMGRAFFVFRAALPTPAETPPDIEAATLVREPKAFRTLMPMLAHRFIALRRVAHAAVPILIGGETGTGKEVVARALHEESGRSGAFIAVNCGALPTGLVESTLFGHRRGAFSGAVRDEPGLICASDRGTLFLDEIGELPLAAQVTLLRALQEKEVLHVGDSRAVRVDLRVVAATHRSLEEAVTLGRFREDLLARLRGFEFVLPPMRDRREDLGLILSDVLAGVPGGRDASLSSAVGRAFLRYDWPLNMRELVQITTTAMVLAGADGRIDVKALQHGPLARLLGSATATDPERASSIPPATPAGEDGPLEDRLRKLLEIHQGNVAAVARALAKGPVQVHRWMKRYGLDPNDFRRQS